MSQHLQNACTEFYNRSSSLTMLNLSGRFIGSSGMKRLADSCCEPRPPKITTRKVRPYHAPLVCLWLDHNDLYTSAADDLARLIQVSPSLRHLHLSHNYLSNHGARIISDACFSRVQVCNFTNNDIGLAGARSLATNLKDPRCTVRALILDGNHLGDDGVKEIVEALRQNTTLKCLDLRYNNITKRGLCLFLDLFSKGENLTLETLHLEEDEDEKCVRPNTHKEIPRIHSQHLTVACLRRDCPCDACVIKSEIDYFLALNKAGRHSFSNVELPAALWPRILARMSHQDPALVYATICERPDIVMHEVDLQL